MNIIRFYPMFVLCCMLFIVQQTSAQCDFTLSANVSNVSCLGASSGAIDLTVNGGTPPFQFEWSNGVQDEDLLGVAVGTYTVTVTDGSSCTAPMENIVLADTIPPVADAGPDTGIPCGENLVALDGSGSSSGGQYSYQWTTLDGSFIGGVNTINPIVIAGTYTLVVTDTQNACTQTDEVRVFPGPVIPSADLSMLDVSCTGQLGLANVDMTLGSGPYLYLWSNGSTQSSIINIFQGTYTVTVTDITGCDYYGEVEIKDTSTLTLSAQLTAPGCLPGNDGAIDLTATSLFGPFEYAWNTGATTEDLSNLTIGTYTVTVTYALATCTQTLSVTLVDSTAFTLSAVISGSTICIGDNGAIDLSVAPSGNYTYLWSNGATSEDMTNLAPGNYTVTVSAGGNCTAVETYVVPDLPNLPIPSTVASPSTCDLSNGSILVSTTGGVGPFFYQWSNGATTKNISNIPAGLYVVTVIGTNGCTNTLSVDVLNNNPSFAVNGAVTPNTVCVGNPNGSIVVSVDPPGMYVYVWSNGNTTQNLSGIQAGNYTVTVSAGGSCTQTATFNVPDNSNVPIITSSVTDASCNGNDGAIDLTITGGVSPYIVDWFNIPGSNNPEDLPNLSTGNYTCTVTDLIGCTQVAFITVGQQSDLSISLSQNNVSCFGGSNGSIDLTATGTALPITYFWSIGATTQDLNGMAAGTYTVTVSDGLGCTRTGSAVLTQPFDLNIVPTIAPVSCFGLSDGQIAVSVSGGTPFYDYMWSNGATSQTIFGLAAGTYTVTVTDVNGCTKTSAVLVNEPAQITFTITSLSNDCNTEIITGPNIPNATYQWFGPNGFSATTAAITANFSGVYTLIIIDPLGCPATADYIVNLLGVSDCGQIKGRVFHDEDENCTLNAGEPGLAGWIVRAEGVNDTLYGVTNALGEYLVGVPVGTYAMKVFVPNGLWTICPGGLLATVGMAGDTVSGGDFLVQSTYICPALTVSIGTNQLRRCFSTNFYQLEYCNQGTQAAQDAFVTVALDPFLTVISASIPYTDLGANALRFEIGELEIGECGTFSIQVFVNCNAALGQTHCTQASIYPDTLCVPPSASWSGASLQINSLCNVDSLRFVIRNVGSGGMNGSSGYIVVEDGIMFRSGTLPALEENDSMEIVVPANGSTWRVEVGQELFHPYPAPIGLSVEGCATTSSFSTGFVNQFPYNDEPPTVDIDCTPNIGSYDPNDKHGYPVGYGVNHYVRPGTDIEYLIRFQNTGTDTAFTVRIVDTLSAWLDPATIRFGASSHPYTFDLNGTGVVHFLFENILLPDSNTNEVASHGFAKFNIKPRSDAPLETRIENTAAIYFDFNEPIFTNTTFHSLGQNFVTVGLWQALVPEAKVIAMPNPFQDQTILEVKGLARNTSLRLQVFDLRGNVVREMDSENEFFYLKKGDWPSGIYVFKITQNGKLVGSGKLMAE